MPKFFKDQLNETQQMLVRETLQTFTKSVETLTAQNRLTDGVNLLENLKLIASTKDAQEDGSIKVVQVIRLCGRSGDRDLHLLTVWLSRIMQLCYGFYGDLKLHKFGGWLTSEQKVSLRTLVADELQKGIERIKASEEEFTKTKRLRDTMEPTRPITDEEAQSLQLALTRLVKEQDQLQDRPKTRATTKKLEEIARKIAMPC